MIYILGSSGYMGSAVASELTARGLEWKAIRHGENTLPEIESHLVDADLIINCGAFVPKPSVSLCDKFQEETITGNVVLPTGLTALCRYGGVPLIHLSTACLYDERKEYREDDAPIRGWGDYCGFYVGTKLIAEKMVRRNKRHFILRLRLPFDEFNNDRNYLSKLARYPQVYDHLNSLTHRGDFAKAALDMWASKAPYGTYTICNPGSISAREVVQYMALAGIIKEMPEFIPGPCPGCALSVDKLLSTGVKIRGVREAVMQSINDWRPA